ncbi:hypothetical protein SAMN05216344_102205 [Polaromonas sp. OV174]|nr:hypothetical protein SAMN05216344_102205 [Polaromonas sp. OV174]
MAIQKQKRHLRFFQWKDRGPSFDHGRHRSQSCSGPYQWGWAGQQTRQSTCRDSQCEFKKSPRLQVEDGRHASWNVAISRSNRRTNLERWEEDICWVFPEFRRSASGFECSEIKARQATCLICGARHHPLPLYPLRRVFLQPKPPKRWLFHGDRHDDQSTQQVRPAQSRARRTHSGACRSPGKRTPSAGRPEGPRPGSVPTDAPPNIRIGASPRHGRTQR